MEEIREKWKGLHVHNRRAIIAITGLAVLLAIIVIATVTRSASVSYCVVWVIVVSGSYDLRLVETLIL